MMWQGGRGVMQKSEVEEPLVSQQKQDGIHNDSHRYKRQPKALKGR